MRVILLLTILQLVTVRSANEHLAVTGNLSEMVVSWLTFDNSSSIVYYGFNPHNLTFQANGTSSVYSNKSGFNHHCKLMDLVPATTYYYSTINSSFGNLSFTTPIKTLESFQIAIYGDLGVNNSINNILLIQDRVSKNELDFIWHVGDISYADDYRGSEYENVWNIWFDMLSSIMSKIPYMVVVGNHEYSCDKKSSHYEELSNFTAYKNKFRMPSKESGGSDNMYYSFDYGLAHFIAISSETGYHEAPQGHDGDQFLDWFENDLQLAIKNRDQVPWIFVSCHRPIYSAHKGQSDGDEPVEFAALIQEAIEPLLYKYQVNIFFSGHKHHYERQYPVYHDKVQGKSYDPPSSTVYLVTGAGGNQEGLAGFDADGNNPDWFATGYDGAYGFGVLNVINSTNLQWTYFSDQDQVIDTVSISNWAL